MRTMRRRSPTSRRSNCATCCAATDKMGAILDINAGAGGTEALDWASMLLRIHPLVRGPRLKVKTLDYQAGDDGGRQVLHARNRGRLRPTAISKAKTACTVWCVCRLQRQQQAPDDLRVGLRVARCGRFDRGGHQPLGHRVGTRSARRAPAVRTSTRSRRRLRAITARIRYGRTGRSS